MQTREPNESHPASSLERLVLTWRHLDFRFRIADCGLRIADCGLQKKISQIYPLQQVTSAKFRIPKFAIRNSNYLSIFHHDNSIRVTARQLMIVSYQQDRQVVPINHLSEQCQQLMRARRV